MLRTLATAVATATALALTLAAVPAAAAAKPAPSCPDTPTVVVLIIDGVEHTAVSMPGCVQHVKPPKAKHRPKKKPGRVGAKVAPPTKAGAKTSSGRRTTRPVKSHSQKRWIQVGVAAALR